MPSSYRGPAVVTGVADGDTLYANVDGHSIRIRLAQIDAPEKAQAFGRRSEQGLRELVGKRQVDLAWKSLDRYGRPVAQRHRACSRLRSRCQCAGTTKESTFLQIEPVFFK